MGWRDDLPDVRDGLTRRERVVLWQLAELQKERGDRFVPTAQLYGRVVEHVSMTPEELSAILARLGARRDPGPGDPWPGDRSGGR
ncbi:MAG: hypothetical protein U0359_27365 [Byssovorax sp.]